MAYREHQGYVYGSDAFGHLVHYGTRGSGNEDGMAPAVTATAVATATAAPVDGGGTTSPSSKKPTSVDTTGARRLKKLTRYADLWAHFTTETVPPELQGTHFRCNWCVKNLKEEAAAGTDTKSEELRNIRKVTTRDACVHVYKCRHVPDAVKLDLLDLLAMHVKEIQVMPPDARHIPPPPPVLNSSGKVARSTRGRVTTTTTTPLPVLPVLPRNAGNFGNSNNNNMNKERYSKLCIAAIRKLAKQGMISAEQKRALLTDMITCSARQVTSNVQMAYKLLLMGGDSTNNKEAMEEFAEQCQVFAQELLYGRGGGGGGGGVDQTQQRNELRETEAI